MDVWNLNGWCGNGVEASRDKGDAADNGCTAGDKSASRSRRT